MSEPFAEDHTIIHHMLTHLHRHHAEFGGSAAPVALASMDSTPYSVGEDGVGFAFVATDGAQGTAFLDDRDILTIRLNGAVWRVEFNPRIYEAAQLEGGEHGAPSASEAQEVA